MILETKNAYFYLIFFLLFFTACSPQQRTSNFSPTVVSPQKTLPKSNQTLPGSSDITNPPAPLNNHPVIEPTIPENSLIDVFRDGPRYIGFYCGEWENSRGNKVTIIKSDGTGYEELDDLYDLLAWSPYGDGYFDPMNQVIIRPPGNRMRDLVFKRPETENISLPVNFIWSPNGQWIAFDVWKDVYVMRSDGTDMVNLTDSETYDFYPVWSPDGETLAYICEDNSKGDYGRAICTAKKDGSDKRTLTEFMGFCCEKPSWSNSGQFLVIELPIESQVYTNSNFSSYIINVNTGEKNETIFYGTQPSWSPNGKKIAYIGENDYLWVSNIDGTEAVQLSDFPAKFPSWSAHGKQLAFYANYSKDGGLYVVNVDGTDLRNLAQCPDEILFDAYPTWEP